jgi:cysteinyl-tRNA synthetase
LYGLDISQWPSKKRRYHKDTYPGTHWNKGDFILWHGYKKGDKYFWDTRIGKGRPSWNIQDPSMIKPYFSETLSIYCGGIDNLFRHHDYTKAILESIRPHPMARYWLHCEHLYVNGQKMSKSRGNIIYTDWFKKQGYRMSEVRFFLIYGQYRERINYSEKQMRMVVNNLRTFRRFIKQIDNKEKKIPDSRGKTIQILKKTFAEHMDNDLNVQKAFDGLYSILYGIKTENLSSGEAAGIIKTIKEIDEVFRVIF